MPPRHRIEERPVVGPPGPLVLRSCSLSTASLSTMARFDLFFRSTLVPSLCTQSFFTRQVLRLSRGVGRRQLLYRAMPSCVALRRRVWAGDPTFLFFAPRRTNVPYPAFGSFDTT
eukprot:GHVT01059639.1.p1 GENE.GHVT01059639.1~~GHVT01059639.1.p1  ORF type:complete len:115 (+),score=6.97 GHVT01059639.1:310-654(+)